MVDAVEFISFMLSAGIINLSYAQSTGKPAAVAFFTAIGFDLPTAQQLATQLMSRAAANTASPSVSLPAGPTATPRTAPPPTVGATATPNVSATAPATASPTAPPRLTVLPSGYPLLARP